MTIVVVTNLVQQAHRLADRVAFLNARRADRGRARPTSIFSEHPRSS